VKPGIGAAPRGPFAGCTAALPSGHRRALGKSSHSVDYPGHSHIRKNRGPCGWSRTRSGWSSVGAGNHPENTRLGIYRIEPASSPVQPGYVVAHRPYLPAPVRGGGSAWPGSSCRKPRERRRRDSGSQPSGFSMPTDQHVLREPPFGACCQLAMRSAWHFLPRAHCRIARSEALDRRVLPESA